MRKLWPSSNHPNPTEPSQLEWQIISSECRLLQDEMLNWARGGVAADPRSRYDGTLASLIEIYQTDPDSPFREMRHQTQLVRAGELGRLAQDVGDKRLAALTFRDIKRWHEQFLGPEHCVARAHARMSLIRAAVAFGRLLKLPDCTQIAEDLNGMRFQGIKKRTQFLTAPQVVRVRAVARQMGYQSVALAQAFQFELMLRQKDVIGEWLPLAEPGISDISTRTKKWVLGIHWRDIDTDLVLRKQISKSLRGRRSVGIAGAGKVEEFDLRAYPMIMEELSFSPRGENGPLIVSELTGLPWRQEYFRRVWRNVADAAGIPKAVQNRDSRAGGITEGRKAGASLEDLRHHAGHADIKMTLRYDRGDVETNNKIAHLRTGSRASREQ